MYWPCENGLIITAPTGIILVFIRVPQKSFPVSWFEYPDRPEREAFLFESDIIDRMPPDEREKEIQLEMVSAGSGRVRVDWKWVMKAGKTHIPQMSIEIFRSRMVGRRTTEGSTDSGDFIFKTRHMTSGLVNLRTCPSCHKDLMARDIARPIIVLDRISIRRRHFLHLRHSPSSKQRHRHPN